MTALPSLPLLVPVVATTGRNLCDSPLPTDTCARCSVCLAMASVLGFVRRCLPARAAAALASSLYFLQGTLQKIHLHRLLGEQALELKDFLSVGRRMDTRARCFFAWFSRFKLSAPLVEASSGYPELLSQLIHALASPHPFYGTSGNIAFVSPLAFPLPESVPIASVPIQGVSPPGSEQIAEGSRYDRNP